MKATTSFPKPGKIDTEWCKERLVQIYPDTSKSGWKRTRKYKDGAVNVRIFSYTNGDQVEVRENLSDVSFAQSNPMLSIVMVNGTVTPVVDIPKLLKSAASKIRHCGDYGILHYNAKKRSVLWCGGDGDGYVLNGHTSCEQIESLLRVPGIKTVEVEAENEPDEDDPDWQNLGHHGVKLNTVFYGVNTLCIPSPLQEGFLMIEFEKTYTPAVLCHVRQVSSEIYEIFSFHHHEIFKFSKDLTPISIGKTPKIISTFSFKQPLAPVYTDAINDIYDFLNMKLKASVDETRGDDHET